MGDEQAAPETKGATSEVLATVDLGPEIEGMAGRQLRMRMVNIEPGGVFGRLRPARNDHRPSRWSRYGVRAGSGLAPKTGTRRTGSRTEDRFRRWRSRSTASGNSQTSAGNSDAS